MGRWVKQLGDQGGGGKVLTMTLLLRNHVPLYQSLEGTWKTLEEVDLSEPWCLFFPPFILFPSRSNVTLPLDLPCPSLGLICHASYFLASMAWIYVLVSWWAGWVLEAGVHDESLLEPGMDCCCNKSSPNLTG